MPARVYRAPLSAKHIADLRFAVLEAAETIPSISGSNRGDAWHGPFDFLTRDWPGRQLMRDACPWDLTLALQGWAMVYRQGASSVVHSHVRAAMTSVLYVSQGSCLHIQIGSELLQVSPEPGTVVEFSQLPHAVAANHGADPRVSVVFDHLKC